jgi:hypothetical protein
MGVTGRVAAILLAVEAAVFGVGVSWVLFARSLLQADAEGPAVVVWAFLCVAHLWSALALWSRPDRPPRFVLVPVLVLQVPLLVWWVAAGEPLYYVLALLAGVVLVAGVRALVPPPEAADTYR